MGQSDNTPINKGNYSMETSLRETLFEEYRGEGWQDEYQRYRNAWVKCAKEKIVSDYPLCVDIELSTVCNLKCSMCFTILDSFQNKVNKRFMEEGLFKSIIDQVVGKVPSVRLSFRGESTLHPQFIEFISYAKKKGIPEISFLTNGSTLTKENFENMMFAGADWITVSVDGLQEEYEKIRKPLLFEDTLNKLKAANESKEAYGRHKPVIKVQTIWPAIRENPEKYYKTFMPYVDLIAFNPIIDFSKTVEKPVCVEGFSCPQLYQRLIVTSSGLALKCTNDEEESIVLGDLMKEDIYDVWHGERLNEIRELHRLKDGFKQISTCKNCFIPRKTDETERAFVEGREFIIQNYQ